MAKVVGIHQLELKPGVTAEEFEKFFREEYLPNEPKFPDSTMSLMKGDKGERDGKYLLLSEFDSLGARAELFIDEAGQTPEIKQVWHNWGKLTALVDSNWSDYVELYKIDRAT